ncbi:DUF956 family protein [Lachnobacterium bovis]|uniref:DUF956 family protein n=2 Tax=Lachnobacterium bovis TaxID=140626 RepID=A0A1H9SZV4_9FIRM|nr:DUF956 family protein [Lachnobacterium bovis]SER90357.1 hypothetical protein SAMN02910429_01442 [Lachnobacterium bovis]
MISSMNTKVDLTMRASAFIGMTKTGQIMIGDKAFEFYGEKSKRDYIQIPWDKIDYIAASVYANKWIARFTIFIKDSDKYYSFSGKNNKELLRAVRNYIPEKRLVKSLSFFDVIRKGICGLFHRNKL